MDLRLSDFGRTLGTSTGIGDLMDDLGAALADKSKVQAMLGGGQPAEIPAMTALFYDLLQQVMQGPADLQRTLGQYDPAEGEQGFRTALATLMRDLYGWDISTAHVGVSAGGQSACFHLLNALAGAGQQVMVPLVPDYMGYRDQLVSGATFLGINGIPTPDPNQAHRFKYSLDRAAIAAAPATVRLMVLSRPTNPSGNVLSDDDIRWLSDQCATRGIPLVIDHAYGAPFPNAVYTPTTQYWAPHHIHLYSLSKLGLPGTRTSILVAAPEVVTLMQKMTAVTSLANPGLGQALITPLLQDGFLPRLCQEHITPFYQQRRDLALAALDQELQGLDYAIHQAEGAFFLWLWLPGVNTTALAAQLKERGVLVIPGHWFFFGQPEGANLPHHSECLRLTYSMPEPEVLLGLKILAEELRRVTP